MIATKPSRVVLGLDPATKTGWAHSGGQSGVWDLGRGRTDGARIADLRERIIALYERQPFALICYEVAAFGSRFRQTAEFHGLLRGAILMAAAHIGVPAQHYHPSSVKLFATNSGRATKEQMVRAFRTFTGRVAQDDNEADAWFLCQMGVHGYAAPKAQKKKPSAKRRVPVAPTRRLF